MNVCDDKLPKFTAEESLLNSKDARGKRIYHLHDYITNSVYCLTGEKVTLINVVRHALLVIRRQTVRRVGSRDNEVRRCISDSQLLCPSSSAKLLWQTSGLSMSMKIETQKELAKILIMWSI